MQATSPNLLISLFAWRPREGVNPAENFLTEAFVYILRTNRLFRENWLTELLGEPIDDSSLVIDTRSSHSNMESGTTIFPDVDIRGDFASGKPFTLLIEIKWGAPYVAAQLLKYDRLLKSKPNPHLAFLCARGADYRTAVKDAGSIEHSEFHPLLWETVFVALQNAAVACQNSKELLGFMHHQGLSPAEPISAAMAEAYIASKPIIERFQRYAEKLLREFDWNILPPSHRNIESAMVRDRYGRVAIEFAPSLHGTITIGFLYDNKDHAVPFADGTSNSIDLMMRIEASPRAKGRDLANKAIKSRTAEVCMAGGVVHFAGDGVNRNRHTLCIAQRSLTHFLSSQVESDQLQAMYDQVKAWSAALFADGTVGDALALLAQE